MSPYDEPGAVAPSWLLEVPMAHRGLHGDGVAENSLTAFVAAADAGYGVEFDVQLSADGEAVVTHDATLERVAGVEGRVDARSVEELAALRLEGTEEGVPTLEAALAVLREVPVMIELKSVRLRPSPLERRVAEVLTDHDGPVCVASFNPIALRWLRRQHPDLIRVQTAMANGIAGLSAPLRRRLAELRYLPQVAPAAVSYEIHSLPQPAVDAWRERGGPVVTWTVDDEATWDKARAHADNIIFEHIRPAPGPARDEPTPTT